MKRITQAIDRFTSIYGDQEGISLFSAPGRIEIGGNHTDHQNGCVLAASINKDVIAVARPRTDGMIKVFSEGFDEVTVDANADVYEDSRGTTESLIQGIVAYFKAHKYNVGGFEAYTTSDVPVGAGLSSSAAFETLIGTILSGLYNNMSVSPVKIAKAGQFAENEFFGKPCGLMDQMASSLGGLVFIDFKDPSDPQVKRIDRKDFPYAVVITNTKGSHADLTSEYASIPSEMCSVANVLGHKLLRDVKEQDIIDHIAELRGKCGDRAVLRALHFINENKRAQDEADALGSGNYKAFIDLIRESGNSSFKYLQNIYVSSNPQDQSLSLALCLADSILRKDEAVRVHGGGFAGTTLAFVFEKNIVPYKVVMESVFGTGCCEVLKIRDNGGINLSTVNTEN